MSGILKKGEETTTRWELPAISGKITESGDSPSATPMTTANLQAIQKEAYNEGFNLGRKEGRSKGYKEGLQRAEQETGERLQSLRNILDMLAAPLEDLDAEIEQSLSNMVVMLAKHLVRRELKTSEGEIIAVVRHVMEHLPISARHPCVHLHPDDLDLVRNALAINNEEESWRLESDPLISRGGCLVETKSSFIDATVEARLAAQVSQMFGGDRESDREE